MAKKNVSKLSNSVTRDIDKLASRIEHEQLKSQAWKLPGVFSLISFQLSILATIFSVIILLGYWMGVEFLYRPLALGPATHPVTAVIALFLSVSILLPNQPSLLGCFKKTLVSVSAITVLVAIIDYVFSTGLLPPNIIFERELGHIHASALGNYLSINTAIMFLMLSCASLAGIYGRKSLQQIIAYLAISIPCISFIGYAYGLASFYSHMSLYTAVIGFLLGWSLLAKTSDYGGLKAILSPYLGGRIARFQSISGMVLPFSVGLFFVSLSNELNSSYIGMFVIFVTWFLVLMISISAYVQEKIDAARREVTEKLIQAANTDPLTGLYNRRQFFYLGKKELRRAHRTGNAVAVLMIDIDNFKTINDTAGHDVGDQVLVAVSNTLTLVLREFDLVCRFGGEEFCVLITDTTKEGVEEVCNKITSTIRSLSINNWTDQHSPVTVSVGACLIEKMIDLESALKVADAAMYQAKSLGKNQTYYSVAFSGAQGSLQ